MRPSLAKKSKLDSRKSITDKIPEEADVVAAVATEVTDLKVNAEAVEVAVAVIVPKVSAVNVPKVKNVEAENEVAVVATVVAVVDVAEATDHELPFLMVKTDPLLNVLNAVEDVKDTKADPVRNMKVSIVVMAQAVADAETERTGTIELLSLRKATPPQLKAKLPKRSPNASEESASPEKRSRLNPQLKRKKSASL